jgi:hypothetical protein
MRLMLRRISPWLYLSAILLAFIAYVGQQRPREFFGHWHDDTIYFSSARALAAGEGYILPSVPGKPAQTKYPILYPWLLSWVWKWNPSFPDNLSAGLAITLLFSCWFLTAAFVLLKRLERIGVWRALIITALCAFHPMFVTVSSSTLSDVPFMALAITGILIAGHAIDSRRPPVVWAAGTFTALAILTRAAGWTVLAGIVAAAAWRRRGRVGAAITLAAAPLPVLLFLWTLAHHEQAAGASGWRQTIAYYTSYADFWMLTVPNRQALLAMVSQNCKDLLFTPASLCLFSPAGAPGSYPGALLHITLTMGIIAGIIRCLRASPQQTFLLILPFTGILIVFWNFSLAERGLLLFLPLFYAGACVEASHIRAMARTALTRGPFWPDRILAYGIAAAGITILVLAGFHYIHGTRPLLAITSRHRAGLQAEKDQAYQWILHNTPPDARFAAFEDATLYLRTGRQAIWLLAISNAVVYSPDPQAMQEQLDMLPDVVRHVGARYWMVADGDLYTADDDPPGIRDRIRAWRRALPVLFSSRTGRVRIHDLGCVLDPGGQGCGQIAGILSLPFPYESSKASPPAFP